VNGQHHAPAAMPSVRTPVPTEQDARWSPRAGLDSNTNRRKLYKLVSLTVLLCFTSGIGKVAQSVASREMPGNNLGPGAHHLAGSHSPLRVMPG
jgi:hypothetical protein